MAPHPSASLPPHVLPLAAGDPGEIGGHRLIGRLGDGGPGVVYAAVAPGGEAVALQVARAERAPGEDPERSTTPLRHDRSVCAVGADAGGSFRGRPWTAVRYLPGPGLGRYVREAGPLPEPALLVLAAGTAEALATVHAAGVPHGDVRAGTVIMTPDGPRLVVHGIAGRADGGGPGAGAPGRPAPEPYEGAPPDTASDVFSWACLVVLAATGREPLGADPSAREAARPAREEAVDLTGVPEGLRPLLARALSTDPARRPPAEEAYLECLLLAGVEESATREVWSQRLLALVREDWPHVDVSGYGPEEWAAAESRTGAGEPKDRNGAERTPTDAAPGPGTPDPGRARRRGSLRGGIPAMAVAVAVLLGAAVGGGYLFLDAPGETGAAAAGSEAGRPGPPEEDPGTREEDADAEHGPEEPGSGPLSGMDLVSASLDTVLTAESFELTLITYAGNGQGYGQPLPDDSATTPTFFDRVLYRSGPSEALRWTSTVSGGRTSDLALVDGDLLRAEGTAWNGDSTWYTAEPEVLGSADAFTPEGIAEPLSSAVETGTVTGEEAVVFTAPPTAEDAYGHLAGEVPEGVPAVRVEGEFSAGGSPDGSDTAFVLVATEDGIPLGFSAEGTGGHDLNGRPVSEGVPVSFRDPAAPEPERWYTRYTFMGFDGDVDPGVPDPEQVRQVGAPPPTAP